MPTTVRHDIDALNVQLVITLPAEEYSKKVNKDINRYAQRAQIKGFRPGKAPVSLVRSMYGESFLMDTINNGIQEELNRYLNENPINMLGQPILSEDQEKLSLSLDKPQDVVSKFDIGLAPVLDLKGLDKSTVVNTYEVAVDEEAFNKVVEDLSARMANRNPVEDSIQENDYVTFQIEEIGGTIENQFSVLPQDLTESAQAVVYGLKKGDKFNYNPFNFENNSTDKHVKVHFLGIKESDNVSEDARFELEVVDVVRVEKLTWGQAWFDKYFGEGVVTDEAEARQRVVETISEQHRSNIDALFFREVQDTLMANNDIQLPDAFLKRWLVVADEKNTPEAVEREYDAFAGNLRWSIIRSAIQRQGNISPTIDDMRAFYGQRLMGYLGGMNMPGINMDNFLKDMTNRVLNDEKQAQDLYDEVLSQQVFDFTRLAVSLNKKSVTADEFNAIIAEVQQRVAAERGESNLETINAEGVLDEA
jgi:trigger factor